MRRLGGLPLAALAQLAAFVLLLVGRGFGSLADLYPDAFEEVGLECADSILYLL